VSRSITPDSRIGRRPDALPVLSGEIDYAGGFSADDKSARESCKALILLHSISTTPRIEHALSPRSTPFPPQGRE
jgi:hypothetical protein